MTADTHARMRPPAGTVVVTLMGKGGAGKSTTCASIGDALQRATGWRVLLVDLDPQASLSQWLAPAGPAGLADALDDPSLPLNLISLRDDLDLLATHDGLADVQQRMGPDALRDVLAGLPVDVVLIDTRASGPLAPDAALLRAAIDVADVLLLPFEADAMHARVVRQVLDDVATYEAREHRTVLQVLLPTRVRRLDQVADAVALMQAVTDRLILNPVRESGPVRRAVRQHRLLADVAPTSSAATDYDHAASMLAPILSAVA